MRLSKLSNLVLKFIGNGQVKSTDVTLTQNVIEAYLKVAYGGIIQGIVDKKNKAGQSDVSYLISGAITEDVFDIKRVGRKSIVSLGGKDIMRLDNSLQIVSFNYAQNQEPSCVEGQSLDDITYVSPYEKGNYLSADYNHLMFYTLSMEAVEIYNLPECMNQITIEYVKDSGDVDIPADVCLQIVKTALPDILGLKKYTRQKIDDDSNEIIQQLKLQLASK